VSTGPKRFAPPKLVDPLPYDSADEQPALIWEDEHDMRSRPGRGWLRISDESVRECGIETVLQENAGVFMLYYERVVQARVGVYPMRSSEETLKPGTISVHHANGSASSLLSIGETAVVCGRGRQENIEEGERERFGVVVGGGRVMGPRIVRSVAAGRTRSASAAPSEQESSISASTYSEAELTPKRGESPLPPPNGVVPEPELAADETHPAPEVESSPRAGQLQPSRWRVPAPSRTVSMPVSKASSPPVSHIPTEPPPPRIHSPQPVHSPAGPSLVGLTA
jgi:ubiquitin carboxyl-terminal hydrolase 1